MDLCAFKVKRQRSLLSCSQFTSSNGREWDKCASFFSLEEGSLALIKAKFLFYQ